MNKIPTILQVFYLDRIRFLDVHRKKHQMKSEYWSQANRMDNILYIQSWAKKKQPKNVGSQSHIFVFMSTMNFSFIYVFIIFFFCNVFGCVRDL